MENNKLQKNLGFAAALSTVVGMVIGGGVSVLVGKSIGDTGEISLHFLQSTIHIIVI